MAVALAELVARKLVTIGCIAKVADQDSELLPFFI
jgi:hypothetical protein